VGGGYLYAVTRVGITGEQTEVDTGLVDALARYRAASPLPILAGFGISTPEHVRRVMDAGADGVICGSALVRRIAQNLGHPEEMVTSIYEHAVALKAATRPQEKPPC
jgi:tryptophan synthase alpha chain